MNATLIATAPRTGTALCFDLAAFGTAHATPDMISALRRCPGPAYGEPLPPAFFKHSDDQTVVGLSALLQAINRHGLGSTNFSDWAVLAGSNFLGRRVLVGVIDRFATEGAWGVSPHVIPHCTLHSVSGTLSLVLNSHGPNLGVGGGPGGIAESLLTAASLLSNGQLAGVWLVLTGWEPEPVPQPPGTTLQPDDAPVVPVCSAVALALVAARSGHESMRLRIVPRAKRRWSEWMANPNEEHEVFCLKSLLTALEDSDSPNSKMVWRLNGGLWAELEHVWSGAEEKV